jgi:hypothetical protein
MESSEAVIDTIARIMRTMDRSSESLLRSISHFEGVDIRDEAPPLLATGIRIGPKVIAASAALVH